MVLINLLTMLAGWEALVSMSRGLILTLFVVILLVAILTFPGALVNVVILVLAVTEITQPDITLKQKKHIVTRFVKIASIMLNTGA